MSDGVPDTGDDGPTVEREADAAVKRDQEGRAYAASVTAIYRLMAVEDGEHVVEDAEAVEVAFEIDSGRATPKVVTEVALDDNGQVAERYAGLRPNALRAVPEAERTLANVPGVEEVQRVEGAMDSCVSVARDGGEE